MYAVFCCLFGLIGVFALHGHAQQQSYKAAVVEYSPFEQATANLLETNVKRYIKYIKEAADKGSQIIVFPEDGITGLPALAGNSSHLESYSVKVTENTVPCTEDTDNPNYLVLKNLSCAARDNSIYVVVNILEHEEENSTTIYYNTNVVFDTAGTVILKYRKINLYYEPSFKPGTEVKTFTTNFNVTFGIFTCFDILFKKPAIDVLNKPEVTDIIYPSAWFSELPFLTSLSTQAGYARANGINLLSSGYDRPQEKNGGSGIFLANGSVAEAFISAEPQSKLIISDVPIILKRTPPSKCSDAKPSEEPPIDGALTNFSTYREDLSHYTLTLLDKLETNEEVCSGRFCCRFRVKMKERTKDSYFYRLGVFHGSRLVGTSTMGIRTCSVIACSNDSIASCGSLSPSRLFVPFTSISITGRFPTPSGILDAPSTIRTNLKPLSDYYFCSEAQGYESIVKVETTANETSGILTFGFYGRVFFNDGKPAGRIDMDYGGETSTTVVAVVIVVVLLIVAGVVGFVLYKKKLKYSLVAK